MFASFTAFIRRRHWVTQLGLFPVLAVAWLVYALILKPLGWVAKEAGGQAKAGAKKVVAPLLWPLMVIAALAVLLVVLGNAQFAQVMGPLIQVGIFLTIMYFLVRAVIQSLKPTPKKKQRRRR